VAGGSGSWDTGLATVLGWRLRAKVVRIHPEKVMLTKDQIKEAVENLEVVLQDLCSGKYAELSKGDIGWVRIALRALSGEETPDNG